jgi:4-alpha-glucanotransferase
MDFPRTSGLLLHPTSLPGRFGIGDLGDTAYRWVDFLVATGQTLWQVLPLGYTGYVYGNSPYQSLSALAGNPLLISPERLAARKLLEASALEQVPAFPLETVAYGPVIEWKMALLHRSFERFRESGGAEEREAFQAFTEANAAWLDDFALFMALKQAHDGKPWNTWEPAIRNREPTAMTRWAVRLTDTVQEHKYLQYQFFSQWAALKTYANQRNVKIIGDMPIFVAYDSADVWANPALFFLDADRNPLASAGVPPDYFSKTGQLWGNPLYRWDVMAEHGYDWWIQRFRLTFSTVDITRIDHFRGFEAYWSVPAGETTAVNGHWIKGPGRDFFIAVRKAHGDLPIIAEDLGLITADVIALRDEMAFPGMKVLQFAFSGDPHNEYLPHNYVPRCVVYTGTHDNDTTVGWYRTVTEKERTFLRRYLGTDGRRIHWDLIRLAFGSTAEMALVPLQDVLGLGSEARMNTPGQPSGNWAWRFRQEALTAAVRDRLREVTEIFGRGVPPAEALPEHRRRHHVRQHHVRSRVS